MMKFDEKYNTEDFLDFLNDFLPEDFQQKEKDFVLEKDRFKKITKVKELGFCESLDLYVLEIDHNSENDPRVAIATEAFKVLAQYWAHRALVIFRNKDSENYRLSYLTISLDINDKNKTVKKYSNAHRYSFYLGTNAKIKTPKQQLKGRVKDTDDLLNRFSIEVVNKQFYFEVAKYFDELVSSENQNLILPGVSQNDTNIRKSFAVRLIGRLMFCWFLKQKKSDNGQLIPNELLSSKIVSENYYHNIIEPLFFAALNTNIDSRDIRSDLFDKVPYLNGGLFNPQTDDYYELDREIFVSKYINTLKIGDLWFKSFFELLETYNFTIDENTVFDQELSVDPEMLGRIFENLLAEINPETGNSERKRTGSFYTPRQIVEYMVDQSLIEYLKTKTKIDERKILALVSYDLIDDSEYPLENNEKQEVIDAIESLKILDPACGSGAYPIGALQKIVYILQTVDPDCKLSIEQKLKGVPELYKQKILNEFNTNPPNYTRKLEVIKNSIFGVDIQPIAVDVSRLRCFLTLVVESEIDDTKPNRGIEPLPNLDFKFVCANTLIDLPKLHNNNLFEDHSGIIELSGIMSEYFTANRSEKESIKTRFFNKQKDLLNRMLELRVTGELTLKLTLWDPFSNKTNSWFDPEWMFGLQEKFDIVIGNPPYIQLQKNRLISDQLSNLDYQTFSRSSDIYCIFYERGLQLVKDNGILVYITSNSWLKTKYGSLLREFFVKFANPILLIDFANSQVFDTAIVESNILLLKKESYKENLRALSFSLNLKNRSIDDYFKENSVLIKKLDSRGWIIGDTIAADLRLKIEYNSRPLKNLNQNIYIGILNGYNDAFIINEDTKDSLIKKDPKSIEIIKPVLRGRDVSKYQYNWQNLYMIISHNGIKEKLFKVNVEKDYPAVYEHLLKFKEKLEIRQNKGSHWTNLRNCVYFPEFEKPKIIWGELSDKPKFAYDDNGYIPEASLFAMVGEDLKYLLGVLNSKLALWYFEQISTSSGMGTNRWKKYKIEQFPIRVISKEKMSTLEEKVDEMLKIKKSNSKENTNELENQIDYLVYNIYGLGEEDIKIIEDSNKK